MEPGAPLFLDCTIEWGWLDWSAESLANVSQPQMFLDVLSPGDVSLHIWGHLAGGIGVYADPPNELEPVFLDAFERIAIAFPLVCLRIDLSSGGMREGEIVQRLCELERAGTAQRDCESCWIVEWTTEAGALELLPWVHGSGFDYMWQFGTVWVTEQDAESLTFAGPRPDLEAIRQVFLDSAAKHGWRTKYLLDDE
jgi:hypothetical protein